jgi:hypothetical protein
MCEGFKRSILPDTDFLSAVKPRSASFTWRSILHGRDLLVKGLRWNVGNGERISITKDNWIPGFPADTIKPLSPIPAAAKFCFLMNDEGNAWEVDTVRMFFHDELASTILQIPIRRHGGDDYVSWAHDKHGLYTVKSAYNLARTESFFSNRGTAGRGSSSNVQLEEKCWKKVWAIQAPNKMKVTLWQIINDCLPTGHQLQHRHIPADADCVFCGQTERVEHLFLFCPFAREVWSAVKNVFPLHLCRKSLVNAKQWIFDFLGRESDTSAMVLAVTCWHIWEARNGVCNNEELLHPQRWAYKILAYVELIMNFLFKNRSGKQRQAKATRRWVPPPAGQVCVNVDAALFPGENRMGWGAAVCDHTSKLLCACSEGLEGMPALELAEALATCSALMMARSRGFPRIILVSDCLSLIKKVLTPAQDRSATGSVIQDIKHLTAEFESCSFKFYPRSSNVVAQRLARSAEPLVCKLSIDVIPKIIRDELCND